MTKECLKRTGLVSTFYGVPETLGHSKHREHFTKVQCTDVCSQHFDSSGSDELPKGVLNSKTIFWLFLKHGHVPPIKHYCSFQMCWLITAIIIIHVRHMHCSSDQ